MGDGRKVRHKAGKGDGASKAPEAGADAERAQGKRVGGGFVQGKEVGGAEGRSNSRR